MTLEPRHENLLRLANYYRVTRVNGGQLHPGQPLERQYADELVQMGLLAATNPREPRYWLRTYTITEVGRAALLDILLQEGG